MKVRVGFIVDVDEAAWSEAFGIEGRTAIREDVKRYAARLARESLEAQDLLLD